MMAVGPSFSQHRITLFLLDRISKTNVIWELLQKLWNKILSCLNLTRITCTLHNVHLGNRRIRFRESNLSEIIFRQNKKSHVVFNNFLSENGVVCEILWKNVVQSDTEHMKR